MKRRIRRWTALLLSLALLAGIPFGALAASLRVGASGSAVITLQQKLRDIGLYSGKIDGKYGTGTEKAVIAFQKKNGLVPDGVAGSRTLEKLYGQSSGASASGTAASSSYFGGDYATIESGQRGSRVLRLQQALVSLGYTLTADSVFGAGTRRAVESFQKKTGLTQDGKAGRKTLQALERALNGNSPAQTVPQPSSAAEPAEAVNSGAALRIGSAGEPVTALQRRLKELGYYQGSIDGVFGDETASAVLAFQRAAGLKADAAAGRNTLARLNADSAPKASSGSAEKEETKTSGNPAASFSAPSVGTVRLLHWYNDVKPSLKNGQTLHVYDPATGIGWNLKVLSRGRHCDAEPRTKADTEAMVRAFGGKNTWDQKAVYVQLPNGLWTVASTHDMPHLSGSVKDNGFNGHLCVHFLRDMAETEKNDPNYGVANQKTIRQKWKQMTGETID